MRLVSINNIKSNYVLAKPIYDDYGRVLLQKGTFLTPHYVQRLKTMDYRSLYIDDGTLDTVEVDDVLSEETKLEVFQIAKETLLTVRAGQDIEDSKIDKVVDEVIDEILNSGDIIVHLLDIRAMQDHTFGHSVNVCILSLLTGINLGYTQQKLKDLGTGALLHDIGKARILAEVNSNERLTGELYALIQKHCDYGWEILTKNSKTSQIAAHVAWEHHERFNGTGYPRKLKGKAILELARIVAVADVYDALASDRPYRERMLPHKVIEVIQSRSGTEFDPEIVDAFIPNIAPYPIGSRVMLNDGSYGLVISVEKKTPTKPLVKIIGDATGSPLEEKVFKDLLHESNLYITEVIKD